MQKNGPVFQIVFVGEGRINITAQDIVGYEHPLYIDLHKDIYLQEDIIGWFEQQFKKYLKREPSELDWSNWQENIVLDTRP